MKTISIFIKIIFAFLIISLLPTLFFSSLVILSYNNLITEYHSFIEQAGIKIEQPFFLGLEKLQENIKFQIWLTFFLILILVGFSFVMIFRNIVSPLKELTKITKEVSAGNLDVKIQAKSKDEIGELMASFNKMLKDLKETKDLLEEEKQTLEIKVKARTLALEEEKRSLAEKVERRTKELQDRVKELEKFQKITVGRELKMIELKKALQQAQDKIKELKKQA